MKLVSNSVRLFIHYFQQDPKLDLRRGKASIMNESHRDHMILFYIPTRYCYTSYAQALI